MFYQGTSDHFKAREYMAVLVLLRDGILVSTEVSSKKTIKGSLEDCFHFQQRQASYFMATVENLGVNWEKEKESRMISTREDLYALNFISVLWQDLKNYLRGLKVLFFRD